MKVEYNARQLTLGKSVNHDDDCAPMPVCPGIYESGRKDVKSYLVIGDSHKPADVGLSNNVGRHEAVVEIPASVLEEVVAKISR